MCGLYGAKRAASVHHHLDEVTDMDYEISVTQRMTQDAFDIVYSHAQKNGYQKEGGCIMQINPQCKYDYVPLLDYKGNDMTFEAYYNHVKAEDETLQKIHAAVPHLRSTWEWVCCKLMEIGFIMLLMVPWAKKRDLAPPHTK